MVTSRVDPEPILAYLKRFCDQIPSESVRIELAHSAAGWI